MGRYVWGTRRSRSPGKIVTATTWNGALLVERPLRRESLVGAVPLSSFTVLMGLDGHCWLCTEGFRERL